MQHCNTSESLTLNPGAARRPNPRRRLRFQRHDILFEGIGNKISELFQIEGQNSSRLDYLLELLDVFCLILEYDSRGSCLSLSQETWALHKL